MGNHTNSLNLKVWTLLRTTFHLSEMTFVCSQGRLGKRRISHPLTYFVRLNLILPTSFIQTENTKSSKGKETREFMRRKKIFWTWISLTLPSYQACACAKSVYHPQPDAVSVFIASAEEHHSFLNSYTPTVFPSGFLKHGAPNKLLCRNFHKSQS